GTDPAEARRHLLDARDDSERAEYAYEARDLPRFLWNQRAEILKGLGDDLAAARAEDRARATPLTSARDHALEGLDLVHRGKIREALAQFTEARGLDPGDYLAWQGEGYCLAMLGRMRPALSTYSGCIVLDPRNVAGWFNRGSLFVRLNRPAQALADLRVAAGLEPQNAEIQLAIGVALMQLGRFAEALAAFDLALKVPGTTPRVYLMRARARAALGDRPGAEADIAEGLARTPDDEFAWTARATARARHRGDIAGALADLDEALRRFPDSDPARRNKAAYLSKHLGRTADAIAVLDEMIERNPDDPGIFAWRGVLRARLGERDAALADARAAIRQGPNPEVSYSAACAFALTSQQNPGDAAEALRLLESALKAGISGVDPKTDPDLAPLRTH
ncbi:MAG: tetratricopeptide repeat protein, partial [Thermoleophilia bacterium]|nr:tetratricopeptide repeat protein [Thermoleophilia bacterium]